MRLDDTAGLSLSRFADTTLGEEQLCFSPGQMV